MVDLTCGNETCTENENGNKICNSKPIYVKRKLSSYRKPIESLQWTIPFDTCGIEARYDNLTGATSYDIFLNSNFGNETEIMKMEQVRFRCNLEPFLENEFKINPTEDKLHNHLE